MGQQQSSPSGDMIVMNRDSQPLPSRVKEAMTQTKLGSGRWENNNIARYIPNVMQWKVKKGLVVDDNQQPKILVHLSCIKFEHLLQLSVRENNIESIEALNMIFMPAIEKIYLCQNYITNLRPLRKLYAPNLVFLSLTAYESMQTVYFTFLQSDSLSELFIFTKKGESSKTKKPLYSCNNLAKMKSNYFNKAWLGRCYQITNNKSFDVLSRKYKNLSFEMPQKLEDTSIKTDPCGM